MRRVVRESKLALAITILSCGAIAAQESSLFHNPIQAQRQFAANTQGSAGGPMLLANNSQMAQGTVANAGQYQPNAAMNNPLRSDAPNSLAGQLATGNQQQMPMQQMMQPNQMQYAPIQGPANLQNQMNAASPYSFSPLSIQSAASYNFQPPPRQRVLKIQDIVQIRVDELARMSADGNASARKSGLYDARLQDWVKLEGLSLKPATMSDGEPRARGQTNQTYRANSQLVTRESLTFNIAAKIVDIYPNGNIVLEAHKSIDVNDNRWRLSLSGVCQDSAIGADNVVLSKDIVDLKIEKQEQGQARDGYKRGWFAEWMGRFQPF